VYLTLLFHLQYKPAAQKVKMDMKNSSAMSSRLCTALVAIPVVLWSLPLFCFKRVTIVFRDIIYIINILYS
jgi:hypothetical protein